MSTGTKVAEHRERAGLSQSALARRVGVSQATIAKIEGGQTVQSKHLPQIARALGISLGELDPDLQSLGAFRPEITPGEKLVGPGGFPVYAAAEGGNGHMIVTFDAVEHVKWPSVLEGVRGAYAILIVGDSLAKAYRHGDMALVHPGLPPARDEVHVLYHTPPDGQAEAIVKNVLGWNDRVWKLEQFNPHLEFEEHRVDWPVCHRVVGKYARR